MKERKALENNLDTEKTNLRKYDDLQEELNRLNDSINRCLEIVNSSVQGSSVKSKIEDYVVMNDSANKVSVDNINRNVENIENSIKDINDQINDMYKKDNQ
jgi:methyl-accepting chemotaxis protein